MSASSHWQQHLRDFWGASAASFLATAADGLLYLALLWTLVEAQFFGIGVAAAVGAVVGGFIHYGLSRFWVFRRFQAPLVQSAATYFAMSWLAALIHGVLTQWLAAGFDPKLAWFLSKGIVWVGWTYPMSRWVVFGGIGTGDRQPPEDSRQQGSE